MKDYYIYKYANVTVLHRCTICQNDSLRGFVMSIKISELPIPKYKEISYCETCIKNKEDLTQYILLEFL